MSFARTLRQLKSKAGKSGYRLAKYSGLDQAYVLRLETGERANPSRDVVLMLAFALVESSDAIGIGEVDELLLEAGYAPLKRRGLGRLPAA